jgi:hypothetical protein
MKKGFSEMSKGTSHMNSPNMQQKKRPISPAKKLSYNVDLGANAGQEDSKSDKWSIPDLDSGSLDLRK